MVFTKLSAQEKGAFFGLLDEYFQSRPELFKQGGGQGVSGLAGTGISTTAAASAVQRALAVGNSATGSNGRTGVGASGLGKSNNPFSAAGLATPSSGDVAHAMTVGRVAAASLAFSQAQAHPGGGGGGISPSLSPSPAHAHVNADVHSSGPPVLPRRAMLDVSAYAPVGQSVIATPGSEVDKLVTRKASVFSALKKQPTAGVTIPSAFVAPKSPFGPPPARRAASETSADDGSGAGASASTQNVRVGGTRAAQRLPVATPQPQPPEEAGEWVEVLYDYGSEDPGDLAIEAGKRVLVTARSSEDWWTGQVEGQGREGLFPASYVKLL
ncbi:hypothetical protein EV363DRAFT_1568543 [Boletus edulis]|nr:hypothetical protein EV363DRAFT_1568543 [Boletus edulis]